VLVVVVCSESVPFFFSFSAQTQRRRAGMGAGDVDCDGLWVSRRLPRAAAHGDCTGEKTLDYSTDFLACY